MRLAIALLLALAICLALYQFAKFRYLRGGGTGSVIDMAFPPKAEIPDEQSLSFRLNEIGWQSGSEVFVRIFKRESELEIFGRHNGEWVLLKTWPICRWSGVLGPKWKEGDRQSPEGFYLVSKRQLNPNSSHHLAFNLGFPNSVETVQGRTGSYLMVHGDCASVGCYAMTNAGIDEIYGIVEAALNNGQAAVPVHAFPFRLTDENLADFQDHPAFSFWTDLKPGFDAFESGGELPIVLACGGRYAFATPDTPAPRGCSALAGW